MKFIGNDGEIEFTEGTSFVKIRKGKKGPERNISVANIVYVELIKPGLTSAGCIHIQVLGATTYRFSANIAHLASDINAICFWKSHYDEAKIFKESFDKFLESSRTIKSNSVPELDEIRTLKKLLNEGIIKQEDFNNKLDQILKL